MTRALAVYTLKVGSNNETGQLEIDKLREILDRHFDGYEMTPALGSWQGEHEASVRVEVITNINEEQIRSICEEIKVELKQEAVAVTMTGIGYII